MTMKTMATTTRPGRRPRRGGGRWGGAGRERGEGRPKVCRLSLVPACGPSLPASGILTALSVHLAAYAPLQT